MLKFISMLCFAGLLAACGTSPKSYDDATPLTLFEMQRTVIPLWAQDTGDMPESAHAQLPVAVDKGRVYVANQTGKVIVYDAKSGKLQWQVSLNEAISGGPGVGPQRIYLATREAELVALDKFKGNELWRKKISGEMLASPIVVGGKLVVQTIVGKVSMYDAKTGKSIWAYARTIPKLTLRGTSTPVVIGEKVLAGFSDGRLVGLDRATGELLWETTIAVPHGRTDLERLVDIDGLFQATDDIVYVSSFQGRVAAVSVTDGSVLWVRDMSSYTGLAMGKDQVYITDVESKVWALDGRTGATLWRQDKLMGRELSTPAVLGDTVVVADYDGYVHWLSSEDGQFLARQNLEKTWEKLRYVWDDEDPEERYRSVSVFPLATADMLYVRDNIGALTAFQLLR